jgi:hypothetical protein
MSLYWEGLDNTFLKRRHQLSKVSFKGFKLKAGEIATEQNYTGIYREISTKLYYFRLIVQ